MSKIGAHLLGRKAPPDTMHVALHPFTAAVPSNVEVTIKRPTLDVYNQKRTPRCAGYSFSKLMNKFNSYAFDADWLYLEAKKTDAWPNEDGTSARYICDVLRNQGHLRKIGGKDVKTGPDKRHGISSNTWASTVDEIRAVFARKTPQPVMIGIEWLQAWFTPFENNHYEWELQAPSVAGGSAGGHEIGIWACSDRRQAFGLSNTWGDWPKTHNDLVWLPYATMAWLFGAQADACVVRDLPTR